MKNARIVFNNSTEQVYLVPKKGYVLEQDISTIGGLNILRIYTMSEEPVLTTKEKWSSLKKYKVIELLFTANLDGIKYITYDE